jgi:hypothetical protein
MCSVRVFYNTRAIARKKWERVVATSSRAIGAASLKANYQCESVLDTMKLQRGNDRQEQAPFPRLYFHFRLTPAGSRSDLVANRLPGGVPAKLTNSLLAAVLTS